MISLIKIASFKLINFHILFNWRKLAKIRFYSVEKEASKNIEENERELFKDAIVSSQSLNKGFVAQTKLKNAIPEVKW